MPAKSRPENEKTGPVKPDGQGVRALLVSFPSFDHLEQLDESRALFAKVCRTLYLWDVDIQVLPSRECHSDRDMTDAMIHTIGRFIHQEYRQPGSKLLFVHIDSHGGNEEGQLLLTETSEPESRFAVWDKVQRFVQASCPLDILFSLDCCSAGHIRTNPTSERRSARQELLLACSDGQTSYSGDTSFTSELARSFEDFFKANEVFDAWTIVSHMMRKRTTHPHNETINRTAYKLQGNLHTHIKLQPCYETLWHHGEVDAAQEDIKHPDCKTACVVYSPCHLCLPRQHHLAPHTNISYLPMSKAFLITHGKGSEGYPAEKLNILLLEHSRWRCNHPGFQLRYCDRLLDPHDDLSQLKRTAGGLLVLQAVPLAEAWL